MVNIRPARESEQTLIRQMVRAARLDPTALRWQQFFVAEDEGKVIGIGQVRQHKDCRELGSLIVQRAYRGRGIGESLIAALEAHFGLPLYLFCRDTLEPYYTRFGYQRIAFDQVPSGMRFKVRIAALIGRVLRIRLIVMLKS